MWEDLVAWLLSLGDEYGVDPIVYAAIYVGAAPFFLGSTAWLVRSVRRHEPLALPVLSTVFFFSLPTIYVFWVGRNLPAWVYALLLALTAVGAVMTTRAIRERLRRSRGVKATVDGDRAGGSADQKS